MLCKCPPELGSALGTTVISQLGMILPVSRSKQNSLRLSFWRPSPYKENEELVTLGSIPKSVLNPVSGVAAQLDAERGCAAGCDALVLELANLAPTRRLWPGELLGKNKTSKHSKDRLRLLWNFFTERFLPDEIGLDEHGTRVRAILVALFLLLLICCY